MTATVDDLARSLAVAREHFSAQLTAFNMAESLVRDLQTLGVACSLTVEDGNRLVVALQLGANRVAACAARSGMPPPRAEAPADRSSRDRPGSSAWSDAETAAARAVLDAGGSAKDLVERLPHRSHKSCSMKLYKMRPRAKLGLDRPRAAARSSPATAPRFPGATGTGRSAEPRAVENGAAGWRVETQSGRVQQALENLRKLEVEGPFSAQHHLQMFEAALRGEDLGDLAAELGFSKAALVDRIRVMLPEPGIDAQAAVLQAAKARACVGRPG